MAEKLSKHEWEEKVRFVLDEKKIFNDPITDEAIKNIWWATSTINESIHGMRLSNIGLLWMTLAGIKFNNYECVVPCWTGSLTLGLQKITCPYYLDTVKYTHHHYKFCVVDDEYAMLLMFTNNDLAMFAKGLTK